MFILVELLTPAGIIIADLYIFLLVGFVILINLIFSFKKFYKKVSMLISQIEFIWDHAVKKLFLKNFYK